MIQRHFILVFCALILSCDSNKEAKEIIETRPFTSKDIDFKLFASSDERFKNAKPSPVRGMPPSNWLVLPSAQFRDLNYRFGASGSGEVYVTIASGSVGDNINRWRKQFSLNPLDANSLLSLEKIPLANTTGSWVEAEGEYISGMGTAPRTGYGLAGAIANVGGRIITVKMVGLKSEVSAEKNALKAFCSSLQLLSNQ